jgi:hypothetical protein
MQTLTRRQPRHWMLHASDPTKFIAGVDENVAFHTNRSGFVESVLAEADDWGGHLQTIGAYKYRGRRIKFSAQLKTQDVEGEAALFMYVLSVSKIMLVHDAMTDRAITGNEDWTPMEIVLDVPLDARYVNFGTVLRRGRGKLWASDLAICEVGPEIPTTDKYGSTQKIPEAATNMDLSANFHEETECTTSIVFPGWITGKDGPGIFEFAIEQKMFDGQPAARIWSDSELIPRDGQLSNSTGKIEQTFSAIKYRGKRLRFSAFIRTQEIGDWCGLAMQIGGVRGTTLGYTNMACSRLSGTKDWSEYSVVLDVPINAYTSTISATLHGNGSAWFSKFAVESVGTDIPTTDRASEALNLDFSV